MRSVKTYSLSAVHVWLVVMSAFTKMVAASAGAAEANATHAVAHFAIGTSIPLIFTRLLLDVCDGVSSTERR
jgi:hypothetical protein